MLTPGALGFVAFEHERMPVALRGVVRAIPEGSAIEFVVIDGIQLPERRAAERTAFVTRVRATQLGGDSSEPAVAVDTATADLSLGGALLERRVGFGHGPEWQIELSLTDELTPISCRAVLRARDAHVTSAWRSSTCATLIASGSPECWPIITAAQGPPPENTRARPSATGLKSPA